MNVSMPVRDWMFIDAAIDNTVAIAAQDGDEPKAVQGYAVREAGWAVARRHPKAAGGLGGWPPEDDELTLDLPPESWRFIAGQLRRWDAVDAPTSPGPEGGPESKFMMMARLLEERIG